MTRRDFMVGSVGLLAGCSRVPTTTPTAASGTISPSDQARMRAEIEERTRHLQQLGAYRVAPDALRTSGPAPVDLLQTLPEMKPLVKVALRLHPRFSLEPEVTESKIGGRIAWPMSEPWPRCEDHDTPYVAVLQFRAANAPPQFPFPTGTDLLQLIWCPREHGPEPVRPRLVWRKLAVTPEPYHATPPTDAAFLGSVPIPCRLFPERIAELPPWDAPPQILRDKLAQWTAPPHPHRPDARPVDYYTDLLSVAAGTKIGGYAPSPGGSSQPPSCPTCRWGMEFVAAIATTEWTDQNRSRWQPLEERTMSQLDGFRRAAGFSFGGRTSVRIFECRRCESRPVTAV